MTLTAVTLQNFRSYTKAAFTFSPQTTLILGPNTAGKTNLLEALVMLSNGRSFRADQDREMIRWGGEIGWVKGKVDESILEVRLTAGMVEGQKVPAKKYFVNGVTRRLVDFMGHLRSVLFWPEHLELVTDSPSLRRRYLDSVLIQVDREYRRNLLSYERGLRARNKLLDLVNTGAASRVQLLFWDQLLIRTGGYLTDKRAELIDFINHHTVTGMRYQAMYDKSVISPSRLAQYAAEEVAAKATLVGPHRDDFIVQVKSAETQEYLDLGKFGSRGEQRLAVLWLKLAELNYIQKTVDERPILLLDDILSELDEQHQQLVLALVGQQQTIITSTDSAIIKLLKHQGRGDLEIIRLPLVK